MKDAITNILNKYDLIGKYLDKTAIQDLENYFASASIRLKTIQFINSESSKIIKETASILYTEQPELLRPGGNSYTTRKYSACLRDIEYYLRYASYALIAGNTNILEERVLNGLKDTYNSLNVPLGPTVRSIKILEEIICTELQIIDSTELNIIEQPFQYMIQNLNEKNL